jgi:hypothetical protein
MVEVGRIDGTCSIVEKVCGGPFAGKSGSVDAARARHMGSSDCANDRRVSAALYQGKGIKHISYVLFLPCVNYKLLLIFMRIR